jgi:hypothetical protein
MLQRITVNAPWVLFTKKISGKTNVNIQGYLENKRLRMLLTGRIFVYHAQGTRFDHQQNLHTHTHTHTHSACFGRTFFLTDLFCFSHYLP